MLTPLLLALASLASFPAPAGSAAHVPVVFGIDSSQASPGGSTITAYRFAAAGERPREVWVITPPGYAPGRPQGYDLLVLFDGGQCLDQIPVAAILDSLLAAKRIPPVVTVLVDDSTGTARLDDLANHEHFVSYVGDQLIPWVRRTWDVTRDPHHTVIGGTSAGGLAAAFLALRRPDLFGNVLSQSGAFWRGAEGSNGAPFEWVTHEVARLPKQDVRFFLDVGSTETHGALGGAAPSILVANRRLRDALRAKKYPLSYTEVPGGAHAPQFWKLRFPTGVATLFGEVSSAAR